MAKKKFLLTLHEYAQYRGLSKIRVSKLKARSMLVMEGKLVDRDATDAALDAALDPSARRGKQAEAACAAAVPGSYVDAATREKHFKANLAELDLKERQGELINAVELKYELAKLFTDIKTRIRATAPKCAQAIAHLKMSSSSERSLITEVQNILQREHDEALRELATWKP